MKKFVTSLIFGVIIALAVASVVSAQEKCHLLVVSGHARIEVSTATKTIMEEVKKEFPEAELLYLDQTYPDFKIDIRKERQRVSSADIIVLQYPIQWYSAPAIMKRWLEEVFTFGFAHDAKGGLLNGKKLILSMTSGAPENQYQIGERMGYPMGVYQLPLLQLADLCGMDFCGMVYTGGYNIMRKVADKDLHIQKAQEHAKVLIEKINNAMESFNK
ncbi:MAG: NAD(P)H-dependent oxidoreductase [Synergistaceae bacterium]|nr:NAD(P)H-dependent oxidoreductase [Synergistaceae bacterium]MBQ7067706.1 NAD(P)H-dependent oxidoreductase [Synergistaceae bacterium]MBR0234202.1 NAD(P)H-dependent oxidoreductase [Synergistaceae bacterium]MBR0253772.1 NAD(P)H-dependent oxidoreductase [Synergistaceae bacterium]